MTAIERLRDKANSLPLTPGVYIMKDSEGRVIYVGKSKRLKNRVTSYFTGSGHTPKTRRMVSHVFDFDYIVCHTEIEALALENVLIKKHSPKYNIRLKDSKTYPYVKITAEEYPRLLVTRERKSDKGHYFGPYQSTSVAWGALEVVNKIFALPTCKRQFPRDIGKERPCIYRDMGRCLAPCTGQVGKEEYRALIKCAEAVLSGNVRATKEALNAEMERLAEELEFERAARIRDRIRAIERLSEKQKVVADERVSRDVFAIYLSETVSVMAVLKIRGGALINKNEFILSDRELMGADDALSLIVDYYDGGVDLPREVMLDFTVSDEDVSLLSEYLSVDSPHRVAVRIPERGEGRALCDMAKENAREAARQACLEGDREDKNVRRLAELLGLSEIPSRIEAYDISNIGNEHITASMVVWEKGKMKRSDYRSFTVRTTEGADDYGSMRETLTRRLSHIGDGTLSLGERPDLILLDGGKAHVGVGREVQRSLSCEIPLFGMVKDDYHKTRALCDTDTEISIAKEMGVYTFIYNLQEEAHRFAGKMSSGAKRKTLTKSTLEKIDGIGPAKAKKLLREMPLARIKESSVDELMSVKGISRRDAEAIHAYYLRHSGKKKERK